MKKTKIDWCDRTWNPVSGCLHGCKYCYARGIAERFGGRWNQSTGENIRTSEAKLYELGMPLLFEQDKGNLVNAGYPYGFNPTFFGYRLDEPSQIKKPQNIFVCSMADLFGDWVPDEWIDKVFEACMKAPQHRYLFLTKNPRRYKELNRNGDGIMPVKNNFWFGSTVTTQNDIHWYSEDHNYFFSIEPLMSEIINPNFEAHRIIGAPLYPKWVIIGRETGNRKDKIIPKKEWIKNIVNYCREKNIPVFMKNNLAEEKWRKDKKTGEMILIEPKVWGEPLIQEYPWKN